MFDGLFFPVCIILIALLVWLGSRLKFRRLAGRGHLLELAGALLAMRQAAPAQENRPIVKGEIPPNARVTSAHLALLYTVNSEAEGVVHHISLSHRGQGFPRRYGAACIAFTLAVLGLDPQQVDLHLGLRGVYHLTWQLDRQEQEAFMAAPAEPPGLIELDRLRLAAGELQPGLEARLAALTPPRREPPDSGAPS